MRLPLFPKGKHEIIDEVGKLIGTIKNKDVRAYIIKAVNCHDIIVKAIETFPNVHRCTCNCDLCLWFRTKMRQAQEALSEVEKP